MPSVSQGSVETLFGWDGIHLHQFTVNLFKRLCIEFYQNQLRFLEGVTKTFHLTFLDTVYMALIWTESKRIRVVLQLQCQPINCDYCKYSVLRATPVVVGPLAVVPPRPLSRGQSLNSPLNICLLKSCRQNYSAPNQPLNFTSRKYAVKYVHCWIF